MTIYINDLIEMEEFYEDFILVSDKHRITNRPIETVNVMEVADFIKFDLSPNMFILTTLSFYHGDDESLKELVKILDQKKISGMAIKLNRYIQEIPSVLTKVAEDCELSLFIIQNNIKFSKLISKMSYIIHQDRFKTIIKTNNRYEMLYKAINNGEPLEYFLNLLSDEIGHEITCVNKNLDLIKCTDNSDFNHIINLIKQNDYLIENNQDIMFIEELAIVPCKGYEGIIGYLIFESGNLISSNKILIINQFLQFITMRLIDTNLTENFKRRERVKLIREIILYDKISADEIKYRFNTFDYNFSERFQLIYFFDNRHISSYYTYDLILKMLSNEFKNDDFLFEKLANGFFIILNKKKTIDNTYIPSKVLNVLKNTPSSEKDNFLIGHSGFVKNIENISRYFKEIRIAQEVSIKLYPHKKIVYSLDFYNFHLLYNIENKDLTEYLKEKIIVPINNLSVESNNMYWETLEMMILYNNYQIVADKLFIHKTTVRYRLEKIENVTNLKFSKTFDRMTLIQGYILKILNEIEEKL